MTRFVLERARSIPTGERKPASKFSRVLAVAPALVALSLSACQAHAEHHEQHTHKVVVTSPKAQDVVITQQYVCQIHSQRHIRVKALQAGYLQEIKIKEGDSVKKGAVMFEVNPVLYEAKLAAEEAELKLAELELANTKNLAKDNVVSPNEVALFEAKLDKAKAKVKLAKRELRFTKVTAPFDGVIDKLHEQQGSLVKEGEALTTLSDNTMMWVYFNVPEARYLEYKYGLSEEKESPTIELVLADGRKFKKTSVNLLIESKFNNETGNIPFRADFPNPDRILLHGMTGNVLIHRTLPKAVVIPQRATFEVLERQYVFVVGKDNKVKQREITVRNELEDIYVIKSGLGVDEKIVYEGVRQVRDGDTVEFEYLAPEKILGHQKHHAE